MFSRLNHLIPLQESEIEGLNIAGRSKFCDETGGDYYDYIQDNTAHPHRVRIVIGDVTGHGIASALLMSGVRASFRQRNTTPGRIEAVVTDVNRQVALDVGNSGRFMTLFCLEIDQANRQANWVRAGHEPGLHYAAAEDRFDYLKGDGIALGVAKDFAYRSHCCKKFQPGDLFALGTDGIWEATNPKGEMFGKARLEKIIQTQKHKDAAMIVSTVFDQLDDFIKDKSLQDDATLIIIKIG